MAFCSNCGKELIGNPDICVHCGVIINPNKAPPYRPPQYQPPPPPPYPNTPYPQQPYPPYPPQYGMAYGVSDKSKIVVALLAFFLGTLGVHRFYTGKIGTGIAMAVLTIIGWITMYFVVGYFLVAGVGIWALVDFVMALMGKFTDKYGRPIVN